MVKESDYPMISEWLDYCDQHPERQGYDLATFKPSFEREGFRRITQLSRDRITIEQLSDWIGIGKAMAMLIISYAVTDVAAVQAGTFSMKLIHFSSTSELAV
jgi:hypothetical protein